MPCQLIMCFCFRNFYVSNVPLYGNCFTFNTQFNNASDTFAGKRVSSLTGPSFGLSLIISLDQKDYMKDGITKQVKSTKQ